MAYFNQPQPSNNNLVQYQRQQNHYQNNGPAPARNQSMTTFPTWSQQDGNNGYNWPGMQAQQGMPYYGNGQNQYYQASQNYGQASGRQAGQAQSMTNFYSGGAQPMTVNPMPGQAPGFFYAQGAAGSNVQMQPQQQPQQQQQQLQQQLQQQPQQQSYNGQPQQQMQMQASSSQIELSRSNSNRNLGANGPQGQPAARSASQNVGIAPTATSSRSSIQQPLQTPQQASAANTAMMGGGEGNFQQGSPQTTITVNPYAANSGDNSESGVKYIPMSWSELLGGGQDGFQNMKVIMSAPTGSDAENQNHQLRLAFGPQDVETQPGEVPLKVLAINPVQGYEMSPVQFGEQGDDAQNGTSGSPVQIKANAAYGSDPESLESSINAMSLNGGLRPVNITTSANFGPSPSQPTSGANANYAQSSASSTHNSPRQGVQMQPMQQVRNMAPANVQSKPSVSSLHGRKRPQQQLQPARKSDFAGTKYY